jgi:hypothetical protein
MFKDRAVVEQAWSLREVPDDELREQLRENLIALGVPVDHARLVADKERRADPADPTLDQAA